MVLKNAKSVFLTLGAAVLFLAPVNIHAETAVPALTAPVVDSANIIEDSVENQLDSYLKAVNDQTGVQIAVLTVQSLGGESIESYSMRAAEAYRLGQKDKDNGALLTVAVDDHKLRIEVGYGLEGMLTDTKCGLIIRNKITPFFKDGDYSSGIASGVKEMTAVATDNAVIAGADAPQTEEAETSDASSLIVPLIFFLIFFGIVSSSQGFGPFGLFFLFSLFTGRPFHRHIYHSSSSHLDGFGGSGHSSGGGFGGFGGGGFGGGGGGFGGGGASGGW